MHAEWQSNHDNKPFTFSLSKGISYSMHITIDNLVLGITINKCLYIIGSKLLKRKVCI